MSHFLAGLGDPPGYYDDYNYTGETGIDPSTMQYYRNKATEFQVMLNALDEAYFALGMLYTVPELPPEVMAQADYLMGKYDANLTMIKAAAEGIRMAGEGLNAIGVRFPVVSIPSGLGLPPALIGAGVIAALAAATAAISMWIKESQQTTRLANMVVGLPPESKAKVADAYIRGEQAVAVANGSTSGNLSNMAKYIAVGAVAIVGLMFVMGKK